MVHPRFGMLILGRRYLPYPVMKVCIIISPGLLQEIVSPQVALIKQPRFGMLRLEIYCLLSEGMMMLCIASTGILTEAGSLQADVMAR